MNKLVRILKNSLITVAPAIIVYLLFMLATTLFGEDGFGVGGDLKTILYNTLYSGFIALALSYNLTSGRFDFSVGSVLLLSVIGGGNLAKELGMGPVMMLVTCIAIGMACGVVSGIVYITLKLPPMVSSLGVAMVFEAIGFTINKGKGVRLMTEFDLLIWSEPIYSILLTAVILAILIYLLNFTKFGYNCRSLQTGQKNAVEVGVNEKSNSVVCYIIAGAMMACAGVLFLCKNGMVAPKAGLSSSSYMMSAFLPMFIGQALARYSDRNIGTMIGAFCQACLTSGLVKLGCGSSLKTVLDGVVVLLFLVYTSNSYKFALRHAWKEKKEKALSLIKS